ncbi:hypothetical protein [Amphritea sp.]|uniref:hypothetical protein n=1 Tax=Amphritea sp. TaxID=1872502 RepID=UPI003D0CE2B2
MNYRVILLATILFTSSYSFAGFSSYENFSSNGGVVAPIMLNEQGLFNLAVSVQFIREPYEKAPYESDEYHSLISRLSVEWQGVAIQNILDTPSIEHADLSDIKKAIESSIDKLIRETKSKYGIKDSTEVVYTVDSFYLTEAARK